MIQPEFRFYYFTDRYAETIAFYRDQLGLEEFRSWNRGTGDRGTIFYSPNKTGLIEIEEGTETAHLSGALYIEVDDPDHWCKRAIENKLPIVSAITDTSYGHRSFKLKDPNGLIIGFFKYLGDNN